jgi:hypothetical protein
MKFFTLLAAAALTLTGCIGAGINSPITVEKENVFPSMIGIDLLGNQRPVPADFAGKLNIITIGFEQEHQIPINTWIAEAEKIMAENKAVKFYEVPLIYEMNALTRTWVNNGMRSGVTAEAARERTITVYTDREAFLKSMNMKSDRIYALLLDDAGKIIWRAEGPVNGKSLTELNKIIKKRS